MQLAILRRMAGPGLLFTGTAIGTSHLIQSTRAGAMFGLALVGVILLVNFLKYPIFRFGIDFSHARGKSLLTGYHELGRWVPLLFLLLLLPIVPIVWAALGAGTAGIVTAIFGRVLSVPVLGALILSGAAVLLLAGGYRTLDRVNAYLLAFLVISTVLATAMVLPRVEWGTIGDFSWTRETTALLFIVALAGFMPNPIDMSVPLSLWKVEADKQLPTENQVNLDTARKTFAAPYVMTALMAVCFCIMGAGVMHSEGVQPLTDAPGFAGQLINLYREALGPGAATLAAVAALSVMLTTVIAAVDAVSRVLSAAIALYRSGDDETGTKLDYSLSCIALIGSAIVVTFTLMSEFTVFLDFAVSATFVVAPILALLNYLVITRCDLPEEARPSLAMKATSIAAIATMGSLAVMYFVLTFG